MTTLTIATARKIQQDFMAGKRPNVQLSTEQRRLIDDFRLTRQEINDAYAKARKQVENGKSL